MSTADRFRRKIALIAHSRYPIAEPFAGGMEAHTWLLARTLRQRGYELTLFARTGSDDSVATVCVLEEDSPSWAAPVAGDVSAMPAYLVRDHHAYQRLMLQLARNLDFAVVHNNSLHYLPVAMAETLGRAVITTVHTPPTPWLHPTIAEASRQANSYVAVSHHVRRAWSPLLDQATVIANGIDLQQWTPGPGSGGYAVWSGRFVPEKGAHLAIEAARSAGVRLLLSGPISDRGYWRREVEPRLGPDAVWVGHLRHRQLLRLLGSASVALVTPCWDEPYGLVVAEAMACGTPVAAFARGAIPDLVCGSSAVVCSPGDIGELADALHKAARLDRRDVRAHAEDTFCHERMVDGYVELYE
jgi:glycosyltransferase involved in cell wall biosynthesis